MRLFLSLFLFDLTLFYTTITIIITTTTSALPSKLNITIKGPSNESSSRETPYKSVHVRYTILNNDNPWTLVGIEPVVHESSIKTIEQITVHLYGKSVNTFNQDSIWYDADDQMDSNEIPRMLVYQWTSRSSLSPFRISDILGFQLDNTKSIVLSVTYSKERTVHDDQVAVTLYISTAIPRFYIGTIFVGDRKRGTRLYTYDILRADFSCRLSNYPRLLYGVKALFPATDNPWWRIFSIRNRSFGRKTIESVLNSSTVSVRPELDISILSGDIFIMPDDYVLVECGETSSFTCRFLIYYTYQNIPYKSLPENDYICSNNNYPNLFKLVPSNTVVPSTPTSSFVWNTDGTTTFVLVCLLLVIIWISVIVGCVIMRRIRGLVNFRTETSSQRLTEYTRAVFQSNRAAHEQHNQKLSAEGDRTAQLDIEHMGLTS